MVADPTIVFDIPKLDGQTCASEGPSNAPYTGQPYPEAASRGMIANRPTQGEVVGIEAENTRDTGTSQPKATDIEQDISGHVGGVACGHENDPFILPTSHIPASIHPPNFITQPHPRLPKELKTVPGKMICNDTNTQSLQTADQYVYASTGPQSNGATYDPTTGKTLPLGIVLPPKPPNIAVTGYNHLTDEFASSSSLAYGMPLPSDSGLLYESQAHAATEIRNSDAYVIDTHAATSMFHHATPAFQPHLTPEETVYEISKHHNQEKDVPKQERKGAFEAKGRSFPAGSRVFIGESLYHLDTW